MAVDAPRTDLSDFQTFIDSREHTVPVDTEYAAIAEELTSALDGEVRFDEYTQILYATDGSIYQARPAGVVIPTHQADVQTAVRIAHDHDTPILPRGAGSSLAGQAVGPGCIILDFSKYMDSILDIDPNEKRVTVQPGVVQDDLDDALAPHGLKFAPDPASSNRATIGGGIGNNSTGAHSVRYGITDAYTEELTVILADGTLIRTREIVLDSPEWQEIIDRDDREAELYRSIRAIVDDTAEEIVDRYPTLKRNVSGYNLDRVVYENDDGEECINLSKLIVGAEGTLGIVVEATLGLVTKPAETALAVYCYRDLIDALTAVPIALDHGVSAVELMDDEVFRLAQESEGYAAFVDQIPEHTAAALMLEFDSELHTDFEDEIEQTNEQFVENGDAFAVIEAYTEGDQTALWKLRKAAIPLLMSLEGDPKPYPFIEDATVPPTELAEYVEKFQAILDTHGTTAAYFAHAGAGTLHIRPILNLKDGDDIETMHRIADDVTDLVLEHHGAFSGEHGDGMARTEFNPKMYGPQLWDAFKRVKTAFDPTWLLHPGNVVYRDDQSDTGPDSTRGVGANMRSQLRYGPTYQSIEPHTTLDFSDEGGFSHLVELCNGCGTCRQTGQDTMCPTYRASKDEMETTRGRANMLRAAINGELPEEELYTTRFQEEVLDLCVGCKGCMNDCPTGVDLAKLKAEVKHRYHAEKGSTLRDRLFADIDRYSKLGSTLAPISNILGTIPGTRMLLERTLGIAKHRALPSFTRTTLTDWFATRQPRVTEATAEHRVLYFPDTYTEYCDPAPGKAAIRVLEAAGCHVHIPDGIAPSGRSAFSMGFLNRARERARQNIDVLLPYADDGWSIVFTEPSDVAMFHDEYTDLLTGDDESDVARVGANAYGVFEFIDTYALDESLPRTTTGEHLTYHAHCNQKALNEDQHVTNVLRRIGFAVDHLDSGCCGMAGSFGYEKEHYDLSQAIGRILFEQIDASPGNTVVAPGVSCRTQLTDRPVDTPVTHPIQTLEAVIDEQRPGAPNYS